MKKAVLLHGTNGNPDDLWLPWLRVELEKSGFEVFAPLLPNNHIPNRNTYNEFLRTSGWDFEDNILIGHSSGATTVLNMLQSDWLPSIKAAVLVGTFLNERLVKSAEWYEPGQFDTLFMDRYSAENLKKKCNRFYFVHGDDDPYCSFQDAQDLCDEVDGKMIVIKGGGHLAYSSGIKELPSMTQALADDKLL